MIGFFLYGPQMLIGLCGAELVGPESVGASEGFLGWVAYLGIVSSRRRVSAIVLILLNCVCLYGVHACNSCSTQLLPYVKV